MARKPQGASSAEVYSITAARRPHQDDINERMLRYLVSMSIRTACFVLVLVTPSPWRWFFAVGAIVLPYVAVVIANAGREKMGPAPAVVPPPATPTAPALGGVPVVSGEAVRGETVRTEPARPGPAHSGHFRTGATAGHPR